jgi:hypothetical protein
MIRFTSRLHFFNSSGSLDVHATARSQFFAAWEAGNYDQGVRLKFVWSASIRPRAQMTQANAPRGAVSSLKVIEGRLSHAHRTRCCAPLHSFDPNAPA